MAPKTRQQRTSEVSVDPQPTKRGRKAKQTVETAAEEVVETGGAVLEQTVQALLAQSTKAAEEWQEQRKMMADCIQALTLRESARSDGAQSSLAPVRHAPTIHDFLKMKPDAFHGEDQGDVVDKAEAWVAAMESLFEMLRCIEEDKVIFAAYQLKESAKLWWDNLSASRDKSSTSMS